MKIKLVKCLLLSACLFALCFTTTQAEDIPALSLDSTGEEVVTLQQRLADLGYYALHITGTYDAQTEQAVRAFQEENGLPVTGRADAALQWMIHSLDARPKGTATSTAQPVFTAEQATYTVKLTYGSTGEDVQRVQARLAQLGYYHIEVTGQYLDNTQRAVRAFQQQNGLSIDGVVGSETWQWLFNEAGVVDANATPRPTPAPTPVPYKISVDVTNQITTVYGLDTSGAHTQIVKQMLCSTGTEKDPTPPGAYVLNGATARWCYFPKWGTHAQYWTRIDAYNAFHSVIYSKPNSMALSTGSYTGLGKRASHGCIRLMIEDAKWIYENCGAGTQVEVVEGILDEEFTMSFKIPPLDYSVMLPEPTPGPTQPPAYDNTALPPMPFTTLKRGTESEAVYWLQCKLTELGYYTGSITGGYYQGTMDAVRAFQQDNGLATDGIAGVNTLNKLYESLLATPSPMPSQTPTQAFAPSTTPSPSVGNENDVIWFVENTATPWP